MRENYSWDPKAVGTFDSSAMVKCEHSKQDRKERAAFQLGVPVYLQINKRNWHSFGNKSVCILGCMITEFMHF